MSIASIRRANDALYEKHKFATSSHAFWTYENYYDVDDILASNDLVTFTFEENTPKDLFPLIHQPRPTTIPSRGIHANVKIWQLKMLHQCGQVRATKYKQINFENITAGAGVVALTDSQRYFYEIGRWICRLVTPEEGQRIAQSLLRTFLHRLKRIFSQTLDFENTHRLKFSEMELVVFHKGQYAEQRLQNWDRDIPRQKQRLQRKFRQFT